MSKIQQNFAAINSSYAVFFTIFSFAVSYILSTSFGTSQGYSFLVILLFSLVVSGTNYLINQLYSSWQIVLLWALSIIVIPALMSLTLQPLVAQAAAVVFISATFLALVPEFIYTKLGDTKPAQPLIKRLLKIDRQIDRTAANVTATQFTLTELRGFGMGLIILATYYGLSLLLLHR